MAKYTLILVRHGESEWNQKNLFCGWHDADLSETGIKEAKYAAEVMYCDSIHRAQQFFFLLLLSLSL